MKIILSLVFVAILTLAAYPQQQLMNGSVAIPSGNLWAIPFYVGTSGGTVSGSFQAYGGDANDIQAYVIPANEYLNFRNGNDFTQYYYSGIKTTGSINLRLDTGSYYLVFSNKRGWVARTLVGNITLYTNNRTNDTRYDQNNSEQCYLTGPARVPLYQYDKGGPTTYARRGEGIERFRQRTPGGKRGTLVSITIGGRPYWAALKHTRCD